MTRTKYSPEPGTKEHDRARDKARARARKEVRKLDRALERVELWEVEGPVAEAFKAQRAAVYGLLA
jgi:hypothetical protein